MGFGLEYIFFYSNRSSMVVDLRGLDKYGIKHIGSQTNIQVKIGGMYEQIRIIGVYIREGKDMRGQRYEDSTFK